MKHLMQVLCIAVMAITGSSAFASGAIVPSPSDNGREECKAYDTGFEEHGYHSTCSSCLSEHNKCEVRCFRPSYTSKAEGTDRTGLPVTIDGDSRFSRFDAEGEAMDRCYGLRLRGCRIVTTDSSNEQVGGARTCR